MLTELFDHKSKVDKIVGGLLDSLLLPLNAINQEQTRDFRETLRALTEKALQKYNPQRPIMEKLKDQTNFIKELNKLRESNGLGQKIVWSTPLDMTPLLKIIGLKNNLKIFNFQAFCSNSLESFEKRSRRRIWRV